MNQDLAQVHSLIVSMVTEHLDEAVSIDNSQAIDFYIAKLIEMELNVCDKIFNNDDVSNDNLEEANNAIHNLIFPPVIELAMKDYKTNQPFNKELQ